MRLSVFRLMPRFRALFLAVLAVLPLAAQVDLRGSAKVRVQLEKLLTLGKVLHIAAHPDDENTALLALSARGWKYRTAYLSLTRGEGGQNLIGSEQGELMGVIRTQELLAARRMDGASQYFTRAIDFGFTKTADETLTKWNRAKVLGDVVYVIRKFQPDVIVLRFSGTPRDGHGQHQSSAILGKEAFAAAADESKFPEQLRVMEPWQAKRVVLNLPTFTPAMEKEAEATPNKFVVDLGAYDPVLGASFGEIAGVSRSQHKSQAMGWRQDRGSSRNYFVPVAGDAAQNSLFDGIDTTWARVPGSDKVRTLLQRALAELDDRAPEKIVPVLVEARREMAKLDDEWAKEKIAELDDTIAESLGLFLDASALKFSVVAGQPVELRFTAINRSPAAVRLEQIVAGSTVVTIEKNLERGQPATATATAKTGRNFTQPYWLEKPRTGDLYNISDVRQLDVPDGPVALEAVFVLTIAGEKISFTRPVQHRYVDRLQGELTRPLVLTPPAVVQWNEKTTLFPGPAPRNASLIVTGLAAGAKGTLRLELPAGWKAEPASAEFALAAEGEQTTLAFKITPPAAPQTGVASAKLNIGGEEFGLSITQIEYNHIPPQAVFSPAEAKLVRADVKVLAKKVGYVMGPGDEVPRALEQMGCDVTLLTRDDLAKGDLNKFDAIVTGVRAFNTRPDLRANARRLFAFAEAGGAVVVQYNVMEGGFFGGNPKLLENIGPYPITISQARVTVEESDVEFKATHQLLSRPNTIVKADFDGWVQERGLYFASQWDPRYQTLFSMHDPGEKALEGGTLYAAIGKGAYVFTPLSWFRQLPAGVPGAYRIFANFLSASKAVPRPAAPKPGAAK